MKGKFSCGVACGIVGMGLSLVIFAIGFISGAATIVAGEERRNHEPDSE